MMFSIRFFKTKYAGLIGMVFSLVMFMTGCQRKDEAIVLIPSGEDVAEFPSLEAVEQAAEPAGSSVTVQEPAKAEPQEKKPNPLLSGGVDGLIQLLDLAFDTLGNLRRKLRVNELTLYVHIGGSDDPAKAAMGYGRAWAAIGAITPSLERLFVIKKRDIRPALDYTISNTQVDAHLVTTITIGRSLALALRAGIRFLKILNERKKAV